MKNRALREISLTLAFAGAIALGVPIQSGHCQSAAGGGGSAAGSAPTGGGGGGSAAGSAPDQGGSVSVGGSAGGVAPDQGPGFGASMAADPAPAMGETPMLVAQNDGPQVCVLTVLNSAGEPCGTVTVDMGVSPMQVLSTTVPNLNLSTSFFTTMSSGRLAVQKGE